jgi:hypothetical protein
LCITSYSPKEKEIRAGKISNERGEKSSVNMRNLRKE